jgi:hypothetical protein
VGPRTGMDAVAKRKFLSHYRESNLGRPGRNRVAVLNELSRLSHSGFDYFYSYFHIMSPKMCRLRNTTSETISRLLGRKNVEGSGCDLFKVLYKHLNGLTKQTSELSVE